MKFEIDSLKKLKTWELLRLPKDRNAVRSTWVSDYKRDRKGSIKRNKARFVANEYSQILGADFTLVFSPVSSYTPAHLVFAVAVAYDWSRSLTNVKNPVVNAPSKKSIQIEQPERFVVSEPEK